MYIEDVNKVHRTMSCFNPHICITEQIHKKSRKHCQNIINTCTMQNMALLVHKSYPRKGQLSLLQSAYHYTPSLSGSPLWPCTDLCRPAGKLAYTILPPNALTSNMTELSILLRCMKFQHGLCFNRLAWQIPFKTLSIELHWSWQ
jgi:hypothetical protein